MLSRSHETLVVRRGKPPVVGQRLIAAEVPVALVHDGSTYAVMMASPGDLQDFAVGFSLNEGVIDSPDDILSIEVVETEAGIEARMWLAEGKGAVLGARRRRIAGPTGCGLCGIESLEEAGKLPPETPVGIVLRPEAVHRALEAMMPLQRLGRETRAAHAAAFAAADGHILALREDVGRHNALDKLCGALKREGIDAASGFVLVTSRVSVEMVQKTARLGASVVVAVSAPTTLALETAGQVGLTVIAVARDDGFEIFTRPDRVVLDRVETVSDVA